MQPHEPADRATDAARRAGVRVVTVVDMPGLHRVAGLFRRVWSTDADVVPPEVLRALAAAGAYVAAAYAGDELVGASTAFFGPPGERSLHSHVTGTVRAGGGIGLALKLHQRAWALERGVREIAWTYDPLVRRNAWFNIGRLGGRPTAYLPEFYGEMVDAINAGDRSDRALLHWPLADDRVAAALAGRPPAAEASAVALDEVDGRPVAGRVTDDALLVRVPADVEALRRRDPRLTAQWRSATREVLGGLLDAGREVAGFDRERGYVFAPHGTNPHIGPR